MNARVIRRSWPAALCLPLLLTACSSVKSVWPFRGDVEERSRAPVNATEYQCAAGKRFYVRNLDNGGAAWVILPEREFRLNRLGDAGSRYGNGRSTLEIKGNEATLTEGSTPYFADCKAAASQ